MAVRSLQDQYFAYPLNLDEYIGAECVQVWHYGRTTGVFSANTNLQVTAINSLGVGLKFGVAYLRINELGGAVFANTSDTTLVIDISSPTAPRIDRVVIRYTEATQLIEPAILKGTPSSIPQAPAITRTREVYEISLAQVRVNAGSTIITAGNITDERLNESVCGLVRDGVTGIPTQGLYDEFTAWFNDLKDVLDTETATNLYNLISSLRDDLDAHLAGADASHIISGKFLPAQLPYISVNSADYTIQTGGDTGQYPVHEVVGYNKRTGSSGTRLFEIRNKTSAASYTTPFEVLDNGVVKAGADATDVTGLTRLGQVQALITASKVPVDLLGAAKTLPATVTINNFTSFRLFEATVRFSTGVMKFVQHTFLIHRTSLMTSVVATSGVYDPGKVNEWFNVKATYTASGSTLAFAETHGSSLSGATLVEFRGIV